MNVVPRIPREGHNVTDRVRYKRVVYEVTSVTANGRRFYRNEQTDEQISLSREEQLEAILRSDLLGEHEWPKVRDEEIEKRLARDLTYTPQQALERAAFEARIMMELDTGGYTPRQRHSEAVITAVLDKVMANDTSGFPRPSIDTVRRYWDNKWIPTKRVKGMVRNDEARGPHGPDPRYAELDALTIKVMDAKIKADGGHVRDIAALGEYVNAQVYIEAKQRGLAFRPKTALGRAIGVNRVRDILRDRDYYQKNMARLTIKEMRRLGQGITLGPTGDYPLQYVEVDHSPMDILVLRPGKPPERPHITALIDRYSRYITGFFIAFGAPGWYRVIMALRLAVSVKTKYLASFDHTFTHQWLAYGAPDNLTMDQGGDLGHYLVDWALSELGIAPDTMKAASGSDKGKVEKFIGDIQHAICRTLPGYTGPEITKRDAERAVPRITLHELEKAVASYIVDVHNQQYHGTTKQKPHDLFVGPQLKNMIVRQPVDEKILGEIGFMQVPVWLSPNGASLDGLRYVSAELTQIVFDRGAAHWGLGRPDPFNADIIHVRAKNGWVEAKLVGELAGFGYTRPQAIERLAILRMPNETEDERTARYRALINHEKLMEAFRQRDTRTLPKSKAPPKKPSTFISKAPLDPNASQDGFVGYSPDRPQTTDRYGAEGPFAQKSIAARALSDLPEVTGPERDLPMMAIAAQGELTTPPRSTFFEEAHPETVTPPPQPKRAPAEPASDPEPLPPTESRPVGARPKRRSEVL